MPSPRMLINLIKVGKKAKGVGKEIPYERWLKKPPVITESAPRGSQLYLEFDNRLGTIPTAKELKSFIKQSGIDADVIKFKGGLKDEVTLGGIRDTTRFRLDVWKEGRLNAEASKELALKFGGDFSTPSAKLMGVGKAGKASKKIPYRKWATKGEKGVASEVNIKLNPGGEYIFSKKDTTATAYYQGKILSENLPDWATKEIYFDSIERIGRKTGDVSTKGIGKEVIESMLTKGKKLGADIATLRVDEGLGYSGGTKNTLLDYYKKLGFKQIAKGEGGMAFDLRQKVKKIPYQKMLKGETKHFPSINPSLEKRVIYGGLQQDATGRPAYHIITDLTTKSTFAIPIEEDINLGITKGLQKLKKAYGEGGKF